MLYSVANVTDAGLRPRPCGRMTRPKESPNQSLLKTGIRLVAGKGRQRATWATAR
jgi:hypothetical protein